MKIYQSVIAIATSIIFVSGCSNSTSNPSGELTATPAASLTQRDLCNSLITFFTDKLNAVGLRAVPLVNSDSSIELSGICRVASNDSEIGWVLVRDAPSDSDPTKGVHGFKSISEAGQTVWVRDYRADTENPDQEVTFATRIGEWNGELKIDGSKARTVNGQLQLTDENKRSAAQFIVELTKNLSDTGKRPK